MTDSQVVTAIANIADGTPNTALEIRTLLTELFNRSYKTGDVMMVSCSNAYITANFDGTGLGINERVGWAICNGENGTRNYDDSYPMPYGVTNQTMGATIGANTVTLSVMNIPPLEVPYTGSNLDNGDPGSLIITAAGGSNGVRNLTTGGTSVPVNTKSKGIVTLFIQKINV